VTIINISFIPVYICLLLAWRVAGTVARDAGFTKQNAKRFKIAMWMAITDVGMVFLFMIWACICHEPLISPFMMIFAVCLIFTGLSAAIICYVFSRLVSQAAVLKEESDLTV
jgi:hypothetical protein